MELCVTSDIIRPNGNNSFMPLSNTFSFVKQAGFNEIDWNLTAQALIGDAWETNCNSVIDAAASVGVRIRYAHLPFDYPNNSSKYSWDDFFIATCRAMRMAVAAGVDCAAIHPRTVMTSDYNATDEHEKALQFLTSYRDYAKQCGLVLALENMRGPGKYAPAKIERYCTQVDDLIQLADELEIGVCWDTGHANISAQDQMRSLSKIGNRLKMIHINDNWATDDLHLAPFLGNIDWLEVTNGLRSISYHGSMNLEVSCGKLPPDLQLIYANYMASSARMLAERIL